MDVITVAKYMQDIIKAIGKEHRRLDELANTRAIALSNYDKELALAIIKLKDGKVQEIEGTPIKAEAVTIMEKLAKGICAEHRMNCELAEARYKSCITRINAMQAQLNGYQSINRHLESV